MQHDLILASLGWAHQHLLPDLSLQRLEPGTLVSKAHSLAAYNGSPYRRHLRKCSLDYPPFHWWIAAHLKESYSIVYWALLGRWFPCRLSHANVRSCEAPASSAKLRDDLEVSARWVSQVYWVWRYISARLALLLRLEGCRCEVCCVMVLWQVVFCGQKLFGQSGYHLSWGRIFVACLASDLCVE